MGRSHGDNYEDFGDYDMVPLHSPVDGGKLMKKQKISHKQENSSRFHTIAEKQTYMAVDKLVVSPV